MSLRKFLDHKIAPLLMSGTGDAAGGGGAGAGGGAAGGAAGAAAGAAAAGAPVTISFASDKPFAEQLPERFRADPMFKDIKGIDGLLDSYQSAQRMIGADKASLVQLPKADDAKGWNDFYNKLGRPEAADKYDVGRRADGSDWGEPDKAFQKEMLPVLHEAGVTQAQLAKILPKYNALMDQAATAPTKAAEAYATEQLGGLKKEWGAKYDDNMADAQAALLHLGGGDKDLIAQLSIIKDGKATGDNAGLLKIFAKLGGQLREDGVLGRGGEGGGGGALDPAQAKTQITTLQANKEFAAVLTTKGATGKLDGKDITHDEAVAKMKQLYEFAYPPQQ